jgi:transposase
MVHNAEKIRMSLKMFEFGINIHKILAISSIARTTFYNWRNKYKNSSFPQCHYRQYSRKIDVNNDIQKYICAYVLKTIYLSKNKILSLIKKIKEQFNISINRSRIYYILKENNITYKRIQKEVIKNHAEKEEKIKALKEEINKKGYTNIISIDETRIEENTKPICGWGIKGKYVTMPVKSMKPKSCSAITAISNKKHIHTKFIEYKKYINKEDKKTDHKVNARTFKHFLKELFSKLDPNKEYILLMDNAPIHHAKIIKELIKKTRYKIIFNVPYNPKTNPIETIFGAVKKTLQYVCTPTINILKNEYNAILNGFNPRVYKSCYNKSFKI